MKIAIINLAGGRVATYQINKNVPIKFGSLIIKANLLILGLESVDIILGTDCYYTSASSSSII